MFMRIQWMLVGAVLIALCGVGCGGGDEAGLGGDMEAVLMAALLAEEDGTVVCSTVREILDGALMLDDGMYFLVELGEWDVQVGNLEREPILKAALETGLMGEPRDIVIGQETKYEANGIDFKRVDVTAQAYPLTALGKDRLDINSMGLIDTVCWGRRVPTDIVDYTIPARNEFTSANFTEATFNYRVELLEGMSEELLAHLGIDEKMSGEAEGLFVETNRGWKLDGVTVDGFIQ